MSEAPPTECPKCHEQTAKRIIKEIGGGVVRLSGNEYAVKLAQDTQKLKQDMKTDEKLYANMLGEDKYQKLQVDIDKSKSEKYD